MKSADIQGGIVVFGSSRCVPGDSAWTEAENLGRLIAGNGWPLVTGGYGGVMEAASRGAAQAGGRVVGVLCEAFRSSGNSYLTDSVVTPDLYARLRGLVEGRDAFVVFPGSTGTLVEFAMVWEFLNKGMIARCPLICLGEYWRPIVSALGGEATADPRFDTTGLPDSLGEFVEFASSSADAVELLSSHFA